MTSVAHTPYVLEKSDSKGEYVRKGEYATIADALEGAAKSYGLYRVVQPDDAAFLPVEISCRWFPRDNERRAFVIRDPNKPVDQKKLDALFDSADTDWLVA